MYTCDAVVTPTVAVKVDGPTGAHTWRFLARLDEGAARVLLSEAGFAAELAARQAIASRTVDRALADMAQMKPPVVPLRGEDGTALLSREDAMTAIAMLYAPKAARLAGELAAAFDAADAALAKWSATSRAPASVVPSLEERLGRTRGELREQWRETIAVAFANARGNVAQVERDTGIPRRTLYRRLHELGLLVDGERATPPAPKHPALPAPRAAEPAKPAPKAAKRAAGGKG